MKTDVSVVRLVVCKVNLLEGTHGPQAFDSAQKVFSFLSMRKLGLLAKLYETIIMVALEMFFVLFA